MAAPDDVVDVPSRLVGQRLVADGTETVLRFPLRQELTLSLEFGGHRPAQALLEVDFPGRVVGIGFSTQFGVSLDRRAKCRAELFLLPFDLPKEDPIAPAAGTEV